MNLSCMMMNEFVHDFYCFYFNGMRTGIEEGIGVGIFFNFLKNALVSVGITNRD
jgi:hypothetical protein